MMRSATFPGRILRSELISFCGDAGLESNASKNNKEAIPC